MESPQPKQTPDSRPIQTAPTSGFAPLPTEITEVIERSKSQSAQEERTYTPEEYKIIKISTIEAAVAVPALFVLGYASINHLLTSFMVKHGGEYYRKHGLPRHKTILLCGLTGLGFSLMGTLFCIDRFFDRLLRLDETKNPMAYGLRRMFGAYKIPGYSNLTPIPGPVYVPNIEQLNDNKKPASQ
eukprot:TRINITY_DN5413_c0_g1_i1.p1 TRINITY_DN5413_c0_g1~~TRINITY_DN5413_c0_g1_i1.p1  ORF type:complete len:185 (+),score=42.17 TRINITY_DN5413_c0_g1_i1:1-555(+)